MPRQYIPSVEKGIREALDKVSGIPPVAGGVVQGKVGNLSSANALRVTLLSVLAKTARKRVTYGRGIAEVCWLVLAALDWAGVLLFECGNPAAADSPNSAMRNVPGPLARGNHGDTCGVSVEIPSARNRTRRRRLRSSIRARPRPSRRPWTPLHLA